MTVQELIEQLGYMNPEAEVHFTYNYGDHWRTQVAPKVRDCDVGVVQYSEYHRMPKVADDEDMYDEETGELLEGVKEVVLIGG
jgi:hypothetical protein